MDPIAVLQSRIEQLEAKLGLAAGAPVDGAGAPQGDSATAHLARAADAAHAAAAGHEKVQQAMQMATELNNYTDPNYVENMQQNMMHMQEVVAAEPVLKHHCHCMHKCKQAAPVLESEPIQQVPQMQAQVDAMHAAAQEVRAHAEEVAQGVQQVAETCGAAASAASEQLAEVAQKVDAAEDKLLPRRRNGLD